MRTGVLGAEVVKPLVPSRERYAEELEKRSKADSFVLVHSESIGFAINILRMSFFEGHSAVVG